MMQSEDRPDDLTALFEAQDDALQSEAFIKRVMQPIRKRSRWRSPLLFGAGGLGVGAMLSQIGGVWDLVKTRVPEFSSSFEGAQVTEMSVDASNPLWIAALIVIVFGCGAIVVSERA